MLREQIVFPPLAELSHIKDLRAGSIMARHTVFCDDNRQTVAFVYKFRAPIKTIRCYRPIKSRFRKSGCFCNYLGSMFPVTYKLAPVNIQSVKIKRLSNIFHVIPPTLRQIICKLSKALRLLGIIPQNHRVAPP